MKNILLLVHDDDGQEARLQAALDVTRALDGHLTCLDILIVPPVGGEDLGLSVGGLVIEVERLKESAHRSRLEARLAKEDVSWNWLFTDDFLQPALKDASNLADLIVINSNLPHLPLIDARRLAGNAALKSRKPVLAVPQHVRGLNLDGEVLVAWNGSNVASAALAAATPLLKLSRLVTLFEVRDGSSGTPVEEAAAYLSRHSIGCEVVSENASTGQIAAKLLERADSGRYAYLTMGAYSKPPLVGALFGSVTRRLLQSSKIPLLLAH